MAAIFCENNASLRHSIRATAIKKNNSELCTYRNEFVLNAQKIRNEVEEPDYAQAESPRHINKLAADACKLFDVIVVQCRERFSFTYHFAALQLLAASKFPSYQNTFPTAMLIEIFEHIPSSTVSVCAMSCVFCKSEKNLLSFTSLFWNKIFNVHSLTS